MQIIKKSANHQQIDQILQARKTCVHVGLTMTARLKIAPFSTAQKHSHMVALVVLKFIKNCCQKLINELFPYKGHDLP